MNDNLVSIIMPAYNAAATIELAINSVLCQTYPNWELLICNDFSIDNTIDIINKYNDPRIKALNNEFQKGVAGARNTCIKASRGRYIAFLDSDDMWYSDKIQRQLELMDSNGYEFVYGDYDLFTAQGKKCTFTAPASIDFFALLKSCGIGCLTVLIDRKNILPFEFADVTKEDYFLWLNVLNENKIKAYNCGFICARYRLSPTSLSGNKLIEFSRQNNILSFFVKNKIIRSYYLLHYIVLGIKKHYFDYKFGKS